jgi:hypothetical protein
MKSFQGFQSPTTVDTPLEFFDLALGQIDNLAELKCVGYVLRRTLAYDKHTDWISLSQFEFGIVTKEGHRIDEGVHMTRPSIIEGLKRAVAHGWLIKSTRCPDCDLPVTPIKREKREEHQSEFVVPLKCPRCKVKLRGRERVFYGLHWQNAPTRMMRPRWSFNSARGRSDTEPGKVVKNLYYPTPRGSQETELGVVKRFNPHGTKYQYDKDAAFVFLSTTFAELIGAISYELTRNDEKRTLSLLQEGYTSDDIADVMRTMVAANKGTKNEVKSLSYVLRGVRKQKSRQPQPTVNAKDATVMGNQPPAENALTVTGNQPSAVNAPNGPVNATFSLESYAHGDPAFLTLLHRVQRLNTKPLDEERAEAWRRLCDEARTTRLAQKYQVDSNILLVHQAIDEAIASNSLKEDYLAVNMVRRIFDTWEESGRENDGRGKKPRRSNRSTAYRSNTVTPLPQHLQYKSLAEYEKQMGLGSSGGNGDSKSEPAQKIAKDHS